MLLHTYNDIIIIIKMYNMKLLLYYNVPRARCGRRGKTDRRLRLGGRGVSYLPTGYRYIYNADPSRTMCNSYCRPSDSKKKTVRYSIIAARRTSQNNIIILVRFFVFIISLDYDFHRSLTSCC